MVYAKNCFIKEIKENAGELDEAPCEWCKHSYFNKNGDYEYTCQYPKDWRSMENRLVKLKIEKENPIKIKCKVAHKIREILEEENISYSISELILKH